jgi:threonine/homoserine/homoserine lactone efflux protein
MPGPDNIFVLTESITKGKRNGIAISMGLASGIIIHTIIITTGLSIILQKSEYAFYGIKLFGAFYLFYLAYLSYKESSVGMKIKGEASNVGQEKFSTLYKRGFLMNVLNPKVTLFFIAFLPQFVSKDGLHFQLQMIILGVIFMTQAFLVLTMIAIASEKLRRFLKSEKFWRNVKWIKISVLIVLGGSLLFIS